MLALQRELIEIIAAACCFEDACDLARCCSATHNAFLALLTKNDAPWPELQQRRDKALKAAQLDLDRLLLRSSKRDKQLRIFAGAELQRRLRARTADPTPAQAQFVAHDDLALIAAQTPYEEDDGEGDRPEYAGEARLFYGVRLEYDELRELLYAGRRWYSCQAFNRPSHASQTIAEAPVVGMYGEFSTMEEVTRINELLQDGEKPEFYHGPERLDHDDGLDDLLARIGLGVCHRNRQRVDVRLREHAVELSREASGSYNAYSQRWIDCFEAHAVFHDASITDHANRRGGNAESDICVGYTGYGDGPGPEVVLGIALGPRMDTNVFDLEQQYGCEFFEDDEPGQCIEQVSAQYLADLLGCEDTSLKVRSVELALRAKMSRVADAIKVGTGVDIAPKLGFHVVTWEGC